jgi:hypothetical protein
MDAIGRHGLLLHPRRRPPRRFLAGGDDLFHCWDPNARRFRVRCPALLVWLESQLRSLFGQGLSHRCQPRTLCTSITPNCHLGDTLHASGEILWCIKTQPRGVRRAPQVQRTDLRAGRLCFTRELFSFSLHGLGRRLVRSVRWTCSTFPGLVDHFVTLAVPLPAALEGKQGSAEGRPALGGLQKTAPEGAPRRSIRLRTRAPSSGPGCGRNDGGRPGRRPRPRSRRSAPRPPSLIPRHPARPGRGQSESPATYP